MNAKQCTEITDNGMPLRQGDILFFSVKGDSEKYGIVVTGDCDIAQKKCRGIISYCTVTTAKYYIASEILLDICNPEIDKLKVAVTKSVCKEMLPIVDKPTLQYIVEEAVAAGIAAGRRQGAVPAPAAAPRASPPTPSTGKGNPRAKTAAPHPIRGPVWSTAP